MNAFPRLDEATTPDWWLGGAVFILLEEIQIWTRRRVESVAFLDARSMRRRVSVDLEIPDEDLSPGGPPGVLPLALLRKRPLVSFDLKDEDGRSLPVLTRQENAFVAWSALARIAIEVQTPPSDEQELSEELLQEFKTIAGGSRSEANEVLRDLAKPGDDHSFRSVLKESPLFMSLAWNLSRSFLLLTPLLDEPGTRRVLKFSYAQELDMRPETTRERIAGQLGLIATQHDFYLPAAGEAEAFHFEFLAPAGLEIAAAELVLFEEYIDEEDEGVDEDEEVSIEAGPAQVAGRFAHVYISGKPPSVEGIARIWLRMPTAGLVRAGTLSSALTASVMFFFLWDDRILQVPGSPDALLLAIPSLVAAFIVRPGEHGMATHLLLGIRSITALSGIVAYVGALLVIGGIKDAALINTWRILAIVAGICFIALMGSWLGRRPIGKLFEES